MEGVRSTVCRESFLALASGLSAGLSSVVPRSRGTEGEASAEAETTKYTYDKVGNRKSMTYPNETIATYEYDSLNRLTYLENKGPDGVISSYRYTLGPVGNRLKIEENNGDICDYSYDKLYRLTRESRTGGHDYSISYKYDAFGNRKEMNAGGAVTAYDYDDNDRMITETSSSDVTTSYSWDDNGNMTGKATAEETWVYEWNYDNKMVSAEKNDVLIAAYAYDYRGERINKDTPEGTTNFLIDNNNKTGYSQALRETDASNTELVSYTFGDDLISQERAETSFYHYDGLGSTRTITDGDANITDNMKYYAFGSILNRSGSTNVGYLFIGENYDFNLGYYYLRARLYNPSNGRFISRDIFNGLNFDPQSLHKYLYAGNDPINYTDPSGQTFILLQILFSAAIVSILGGIAGGIYSKYYKKYTFGDPRFWKPVLMGQLIGAGVGATVATMLIYKAGLVIFATGWRQAIIGVQFFGYRLMLHGVHKKEPWKGIHFVLNKIVEGQWVKIIEKTIYK